MYDNLEALNNRIASHLKGDLTFKERRHELTTPILIDDAFDELKDTVGSIIFELDMWGMNQPLTNADIKSYHTELSAYLQKNHKSTKRIH